MPETLTQWPREKERSPFDAAAWNRFVKWVSGYLIAPAAIKDSTGASLLEINPSATPASVVLAAVSSFTSAGVTFIGLVKRIVADFSNATISNRTLFKTSTTNGATRVGAIPDGTGTVAGFAGYSSSAPDNSHFWELLADAANNTVDFISNKVGTGVIRDVRLISGTTVFAELTTSFAIRMKNARWFAGQNLAGNAEIPIARVNASDGIEIGVSTTRLSLLSPLMNNVALGFRNAANSATVAALLLNASDYFEFGAAATRLAFSSPLRNATKLMGSNAANSAAFDLIGVNGSDIIESGVSGTQHNLLGTVVAPAIDPPTVNNQVTGESQCKGFYSGYVSAGVLADGVKYNIATAVRNGAGDFTIPWSLDFANAFYAVVVTVEDNAATLIGKVNSKTAASADIHIMTTAGVLTDPDAFHVVAFGTLA